MNLRTHRQARLALMAGMVRRSRLLRYGTPRRGRQGRGFIMFLHSDGTGATYDMDERRPIVARRLRERAKYEADTRLWNRATRALLERQGRLPLELNTLPPGFVMAHQVAGMAEDAIKDLHGVVRTFEITKASREALAAGLPIARDGSPADPEHFGSISIDFPMVVPGRELEHLASTGSATTGKAWTAAEILEGIARAEEALAKLGAPSQVDKLDLTEAEIEALKRECHYPTEPGTLLRGEIGSFTGLPIVKRDPRCTCPRSWEARVPLFCPVHSTP
jgi:hypothetical protein